MKIIKNLFVNRKNSKAFSLIELSIVILIIGLIVVGIIGGKKLITLSNLSKARALTNSSPVAGIEDLSFWFETTSKNSFIAGEGIDGVAVSNWKDINPQQTVKKDVIDSTSGTSDDRPVYTEAVINGLPALYFDGVNDFLVRSNTFGYELAKSSEMTSFVVFKSLSPTQDSGIFFWGSDPIRVSLSAPLQNGGIYWDFGSYVGGRYFITMPSDFMDKWHIMSLNHNADGSGGLAIDNAFIDSGAPGSFTATVPTDSSYDFTVGSMIGTYQKGYIAELIIYNRALSANEISEISKYLSSKWGIKLMI